MLQKPDAARMYVHTNCDTYSDGHVLGLLLCAGVVALCCAVLCCAVLCGSRDSDTQRQQTHTWYEVHTTAVLHGAALLS